jgi:hypothetical protein
MGLPEYAFRRDAPLEKGDITVDVLDKLHGRDAERVVWNHAVAERIAQRHRDGHRGGNERTAIAHDDDDASLFREVTK